MNETLLRAQKVANHFFDGGWPSWIYSDDHEYPQDYPGYDLEIVSNNSGAEHVNVASIHDIVTYALPELFIEHDLSVIPIEFASDAEMPSYEELAVLLDNSRPYLRDIKKLNEMSYQERLEHDGEIMPFDLPWIHFWIDKLTGETNKVDNYGSIFMLYQPHEAVLLEIDCSICPEDVYVAEYAGRKPRLDFAFKVNTLAHVFKDKQSAEKQLQNFVRQRGRHLQADVKAKKHELEMELERLEKKLISK